MHITKSQHLRHIARSEVVNNSMFWIRGIPTLAMLAIPHLTSEDTICEEGFERHIALTNVFIWSDG